MAVREKIDKYVDFFGEQNQRISDVVIPTFKKILYLIEIDTLSRAAFPNVSGNRNRVLQFIDTCSNWEDRNRISSVQLKLALEENGIHSGKLYDFLEQKIESWGYGQIVDPGNDPSFEETIGIATQSESRYVNNSCYRDLLYTYRNHLLHEFREPGYPMELNSDAIKPYYYGLEHLQTKGSTWELVFPVRFLRNLAEKCIDGLRDYLTNNNLDPYDSYKFGTKWLHSK